VRSRGSGSRGTLGRCHALSKIWQLALGIKAIYIIEILSERFDKMSREEQDKVLIHELMHIPFSFGGGFKHHDVVTERNVDKVFEHYKKLKGYKDEGVGEKQEKKGISRWF
jgi:predicted metallopeptidase